MSDTTATNAAPAAPTTYRWRETALSEPQGSGGVQHKLTRVVEGPGPVPKKATETTDPLSSWVAAD